ncbi:amino acid adenylation domain-containing protein [Pseudoalteromonas luteoviolacea]|uniref:non-ribosomal peptide synthetase n=1 Tax=Pseudoalteromonas luteoviolacea TaxID=43657 RepID=UPI001F2BC91D|nr:amino acid adenylation domain-containing protein [Pseudoalteromonas luteoviolacea]MCF6437892.1 amino acid adenylation domain-containing protein [Pseudoalteromonas luteoviolacea]
MMSVGQFVATLRKFNVRFRSEKGKFICEMPKDAIPNELKKELISRKEEVKAYISQITELGAAQETIASSRSLTKGNPLSFAQQRLWLLDKFTGNSSHYNTYAVLQLEGDLQVDALTSAFADVVKRHESLRTVFLDGESGPLQFIRPEEQVRGSDIVRIASPLLSVESLDSMLQEEIRKPFDLTRDYMLRVLLVPLERDLHLMLFVTHHIASDGWSLALVAKEISDSYTLAIEKIESHNTPLPIQYADFALWQNKRWEDGKYQSKLSTWLENLSGAPREHSLPTDYSRPALSSFRGKRSDGFISAHLTDRLQALARHNKVTLFGVLQSAFALLVAKLSGERDVVIGVPTASRDNIELEELIGFFVNTLPVRSEVDWSDSFTAFLKNNNEALNQAFELGEVPFDAIVDGLKLERLASHNPVFQILFAFQNNQVAELEMPHINVTDKKFDGGTTRFDLELHITPEASGLALSMYYSTELYSASTITSFMQAYVGLLTHIVDTPELAVSRLPVVAHGKAEGDHSPWMIGPANHDSSVSLVQDFLSESAKTFPDKAALMWDGQTVSYAQLEKKTNHFAHYLRRNGVTEGDSVAMLLPRSLDMVTVLIGILKAGATYVPIDASLPAERIDSICSDLNNALMVTNEHCVDKVANHSGSVIVLTEAIKQDIAAGPDTHVHLTMAADQLLAYTLYTSGSTGKPKSIGMPHSALVNLINATVLDAPCLGREQTVLQYSSIGFDMSFSDIFLSLQCGGTLVLLEETQKYDIPQICHLIQKYHISVVNLPYSVMHTLCEYAVDNQIALNSLECVLSSAEQLKITSAVKSFFSNTQAALINHYGPSETHVVTAYAMPDNVSEWQEFPPIGKVLGNIKAVILDEHKQQVPFGGRGILHIGGPCLAQGYLNRPELTEEKFVYIQNEESVQERFYCTGDLVQLRGDGNLHYLGRQDNQFKLRGYRIEAGDVESALRKNADITSCYVCLKICNDEPLLAAYIQAAPNVKADNTWQVQVIKKLANQLPIYMVPSVVVPVTQWPLTQNGKIDQSKLPEIVLSADQITRPVKSESERQVAKEWASLLNLAESSLDANAEFFRLGGNSLLLTRMVNQVNKALSVDLSVKSVVEQCTIAQIAIQIDEQRQIQRLRDAVLSNVELNEDTIEI